MQQASSIPFLPFKLPASTNFTRLFAVAANTSIPSLLRRRSTLATMSFDRLSSLESQPTTTRRQDDPVYRDDPEFQRFTESLSTKLFELTSNISRLSNQIALLGTKRDTERVRERVHDMLEESRDGFKEVGEGIKRAQAWEDLNVSFVRPSPCVVY
jgi:hypothetical protein